MVPHITPGAIRIVKSNPRNVLSVAACDIVVPKSLKFALMNPEWKPAMASEFKALQGNKTWSLIPRSPDAILSTQSGYLKSNNGKKPL